MIQCNLKKLRNNKDITQGILAKEINVSQQTIASWEVGRTEPDIQQILSLADYFNISTDYLLGRVTSADHVYDKFTEKSINPLTDVENNHIKKYRCLNANNRQAIDITMDSLLLMQDDSKEKTI